MTGTKHIRWQDDPARLPRFTGHAGTLDDPLFALYPPDANVSSWLLTSRLPGQLSRQHVAGPDGGREACEARAEEWLAEFVRSVGAVFKDEPAVQMAAVTAARQQED